MALSGFIQVPANATVGGAPIDAFQGDAFRTNDDNFEAYVRSLIHSPWFRNDGSDAAQTHDGLTPATTLDSTKIWRTTNMNINANWNITNGFPLVVMATGTITIGAVINSKGRSTAGAQGHLGGGGGGGAGSAGQASVLPVSGAQIAAGGLAGANAGGTPANGNHVLRCLPMAGMLNGGGAGGNGGGAGGGVVILMADTIVLNAAPAGIDVSGANGAGAGTGGGGGGCVILIAKTLTGFPSLGAAVTPADRININGGNAGDAAGGAGGVGVRLSFTMP
jgi:hypothetical protein